MLAYAANRPQIARRPSSPNAMLMIVGAHVALFALVVSVKMDLPARIIDRPIKVTFFPTQVIPPEHRPRIRPPVPSPQPDHLTTPTRILPLPSQPDVALDPGPTEPGPIDLGLAGESLPLPPPAADPVPHPTPATVGARLLTPASELRPPYPPSKLLSEEEATLTLRLTVNSNGRVIAVDSVAPADPAFLDAARRHILAHWRYRPASQSGQAVGSTLVVRLHFQIDG